MTCESHEFRCLCCGKPTIPILRLASKQREKFHRKKLYCPNCRKECNAVEIRNEFERKEFLKDFKQGKFIEEAKESIVLCAKSFI